MQNRRPDGPAGGNLFLNDISNRRLPRDRKGVSRETPQQKADEWKDEGEKGWTAGNGSEASAREQPAGQYQAGLFSLCTFSTMESELFHHCSSIKEVRNQTDENIETSCSVQLLMLTSCFDARVPGATGRYD